MQVAVVDRAGVFSTLEVPTDDHEFVVLPLHGGGATVPQIARLLGWKKHQVSFRLAIEALNVRSLVEARGFRMAKL